MVSKCSHPKDAQITKVVETLFICETTAVYCTKCKTYITQPEIDC